MLMDELASSVNETFGSDTEWKEVQIFLLVRQVLIELTARLVSGGSLSNSLSHFCYHVCGLGIYDIDNDTRDFQPLRN
jgi:hypothetical protein